MTRRKRAPRLTPAQKKREAAAAKRKAARELERFLREQRNAKRRLVAAAKREEKARREREHQDKLAARRRKRAQARGAAFNFGANAKPRRSVWDDRPAPPKGSPERKRYERSATFARRSQAALAAADKARSKRLAQERAREAKNARARNRRRLAPILRTMVHQVVTGTGMVGQYGNALASKEVHNKWKAAKEQARKELDWAAYSEVLEAIADAEGAMDLDWDIVY